jgi:diguanylate cyclase (GGDEF)-like protein
MPARAAPLAFLFGARSARISLPRATTLLTLGLAIVVVSAAFTGGLASPLLPIAWGIAVALGALVDVRQLMFLVPAHGALLFISLWLARTALLDIIHATLLFAGFSFLGRALLSGTLRAVKLREESRVDATLLQIYDDARLFRLVGPVHESEDAQPGDDAHATEIRRVVSHTLAVRDGFYRLLRLGGRALRHDSLALYLLDANGKELLLKEQLLEVEGENAQRISVLRAPFALSLKKRDAMRLIADVAQAPHRAAARSLLLVPLRERGEVRGLLVVDRERVEPFTDADEQFATALAEELLELSHTERVLDDLDAERRKNARVFAAARAFGGVVHTTEALDVTLKSALELAGLSSVSYFELVVDNERTALRVAARRGPDEAVVPEVGTLLPLDDETWVGRAVLQRTSLPHVARADAGSQRGIFRVDEPQVERVGDLRAVPLFALGNVVGALVFTVGPGERLKHNAVDALEVIADLAGVAIGSARHFESVERLAVTDGLTSLYNRRTLDRLLPEAIARARRSKQPLAVVLTDIDHFKNVNDTYGHAVGDDVIRSVARALSSTARASDVVARYGGEEFCLVLEGTDASGAIRAAERARLSVRGLCIDTNKGPLHVTSSFGVAVLSPGNDDPRALLEEVDANLYKAKQQGRDRVVMHVVHQEVMP